MDTEKRVEWLPPFLSYFSQLRIRDYSSSKTKVSNTTGGEGSFHAMGIVCSTTSKTGTLLLKREKVVKVSEIVKNKGIKIKEYIPSETIGLSELTLL